MGRITSEAMFTLSSVSTFWDQTGDLKNGGFLAHRSVKRSEDEPSAVPPGSPQPPHTLSTILTARSVKGKLSRLRLASLPAH